MLYSIMPQHALHHTAILATDLVTLDKKLTSIAEEAECLDGDTGIDPLHNDTQLIGKTLGAMVRGAKFVEVLELLVVPSGLAHLCARAV